MNHVVAPLVVITIALALVALRSRTTHFECPKCGHSFKVSGLQFALAPHAGSKRYATCPKCHHSGMMTSISDGQSPSPQ